MSVDDSFDWDAPGVGRAEEALRSALSSHGSDVEFAPLDPESLRLMAGVRAAGESAPVSVTEPGVASVGRLAGRPKRRWTQALVGVAALVVVVVGAPMALVTMLQWGSGATPSSGRQASSAAGGAAETSAASGAASSMPAAPQVTLASGPSDAKAGSPGQDGSGVPAGMREARFFDVAVWVPQSWGTASAAGPDWCRRALAAKSGEPFVASEAAPDPEVVAASACGDVPETLQSEHVEWRKAAPGEMGGERTANGWTYTSSVVGSVLVTYVHRPGTSADLLKTARVVG